MRTRFAGLMATAILASTSTGALAQASGGWRISETSGQVTIRHGAEMRAAARGAALAPGDQVSTGPGGRAVLVHDRDFVTVSRNSRVSVPAAEAQATGLVKLIQDLGNAVFKIEKLGVPHFGVNTPYLAAVVKGTTFSVTVDPASGTSLQVTEGAVEVATLDGGARDLIRPGGVATIAAGDLLRLHVSGDQERTIDSPAHAVEGSTETSQSEAPAAVVSSVDSPSAAADAIPSTASETVVVASIAEAIVSKPIDLAQATGGFIAGSTAAPAIVAAVRADVAPLPTPEPSAATPIVAPVAAVPVAAAPPVAAPVETAAAATPVVTAPTPIDTAPVTAAPAPLTVAPAPVTVAPPVDATPVVTTPVTTPDMATPPVTPPVVSPPPVTTPVVTAPPIIEPPVTAPVVTAPPVVLPPVTAPVVTAPPVVVPPVTTPVVITPPVVTPPVTTPVVATPPVVVAPAPVVVVPAPVTSPIATPVGKDSPLDHDNGKGNDDKSGSNSGKGSSGSNSGSGTSNSGSGSSSSSGSGSNNSGSSNDSGSLLDNLINTVRGTLGRGRR